MGYIEMVTVFRIQKGGALARTPRGERVIITPKAFKPIAELPDGSLVLSSNRGSVFEETNRLRCPAIREVLIASTMWYQGRLYAVAWNFAEDHDNVADEAAERAEIVRYEPAGTRTLKRTKNLEKV